jgi:hypothetical protein
MFRSCLVVAALLLHAGIALGADDCVVPQFERTRHVYISALAGWSLFIWLVIDTNKSSGGSSPL